jgi:hypothetical protein
MNDNDGNEPDTIDPARAALGEIRIANDRVHKGLQKLHEVGESLASKITDTTVEMLALASMAPVEVIIAHLGVKGIEASERRGQRELVNASQLPIEGLLDERTIWEAMGVKIIDADHGKDPCFISVELPPGWTKRATHEAYWSDLVDAKGHKRARIFYKAAPYDRRAYISVTHRFTIRWNTELPDYLEVFTYEVRDGDRTLFSIASPRVDLATASSGSAARANERNEQTSDQLVGVCIQWLVDHGFPDFRDPLAYWDVELSPTVHAEESA